jgi:hypothetical protein
MTQVLDKLRESAATAFGDTPIVFAYLFGSQATGRIYGISALGRGGPDLMVEPGSSGSLLARIKDEVMELEDIGSIGRSSALGA